MLSLIIVIHVLSFLLMVAIIWDFRHVYRTRTKLHRTASLGHAHVGQRTYAIVWTYVAMTATLTVLTTVFFLQLS